MTKTFLATCIVSLVLTGAGKAQSAASSAESGAHYTQSQLKELELTAHAPAQYSVLASYFGERQKNYLQQAAEEKKEWVRRSQNIMGVTAKYPRPVDSARNLYEYYMYKASEAGTLEARYSRMAGQGATVNAQ